MIIFNSLPSRVLRITSPFGWRTHPLTGTKTHHDGVDIGAHIPGARDDEIRAVMRGKIRRNFFNNARGHTVDIDHGLRYISKALAEQLSTPSRRVPSGNQRVETLYQHLAQQSPARVGQEVNAGQQIGVMGKSGASSGIHLHFEMRVGGVLVDPAPFLRNIQPEEEEMTQDKFNTMMNNWLATQRELPESAWSENEGFFAFATSKNVVDGTAPQGFVTREQITAILGRIGLLK